MEMPLRAVLGGSRKPRRASPRIRLDRLGREPGLTHAKAPIKLCSDLGHDVCLLQAGEARRVSQRQLLPGNASQRIQGRPSAEAGLLIALS